MAAVMTRLQRSLPLNGLTVRYDSDSVPIDTEKTLAYSAHATEYAAELISSYEATLILEKKYKQNPSLPVGEKVVVYGLTVSHFGCGVFDHQHALGIDNDSFHFPRTVTTMEMREVPRLCIRTFTEQETGLVLATGQPGIGKTRGGLYFALQVLLWRGAPVLRVSYKTSAMQLFLPDSNGVYYAWDTSTTNWTSSSFAGTRRVYALLGPPESPTYDRGAACRVLEFAPDNSERHLKNILKDGALVIMKLPSPSEILAMGPALWREGEPGLPFRAFGTATQCF